MTVLRMQRRGMNFYKNCPEINASDFDNFRYFVEMGWFDDKNYCLEITTHYRDNYKSTNTFISISFERKDGMAFADGTIWCNPYQKDVLKAINDRFGTDYTEIEFY